MLTFGRKTEMVTLSESIGSSGAGMSVELGDDGVLPCVIIYGTWVFVRVGDTREYIAQMAAVVHQHDMVAVPLQRIYYG